MRFAAFFFFAFLCTGLSSRATAQQWAFDNPKMGKALAAIARQPDWAHIDMSPPSSFSLLYNDRPPVEQVAQDTQALAETILEEIKNEGLNPASDGNLTIVVQACEETCGQTKDDFLKHGLGTASYKPQSTEIIFEPPFPYLDVEKFCSQYDAPMVRNDCIQREQSSYDYIKDVWNEASPKTKMDCSRPGVEYQWIQGCISSRLDLQRLQKQQKFHY